MFDKYRVLLKYNTFLKFYNRYDLGKNQLFIQHI